MDKILYFHEIFFPSRAGWTVHSGRELKTTQNRSEFIYIARRKKSDVRVLKLDFRSGREEGERKAVCDRDLCVDGGKFRTTNFSATAVGPMTNVIKFAVVQRFRFVTRDQTKTNSEFHKTRVGNTTKSASTTN